MTELEARYRRVLRVLPAPYRADWEADMVTTFLAAVADENDAPEDAALVAEHGRPSRAEIASVLALAVRLRFGGAQGPPRAFAYGEAARRVGLTVLLIGAVFAAIEVAGLAWMATEARPVPGPPAPVAEPPYPVAPLPITPAPLDWLLGVASLVWLAAFLALVAGRARIAALLAGVGLLHQVSRSVVIPMVLGIPAAGEAITAAVLATLLLSLAAFHSGAPPIPRGPWLWALVVGLAVSPVLALLAHRIDPGWPGMLLIDGAAVQCALVVAAGTGCLIMHIADRVGPAWPLALAALAGAALIMRALSLGIALRQIEPSGHALATTVGITQAAAVLTVGVALAALGTRSLRKLPTAAGPGSLTAKRRHPSATD